MAYSADTFVADEQPTTAKWNKLWANDASFNDGTGIASNAITYAKLASTIFSGRLASYTNTGTAGGTITWANLGGIKLAFGKSIATNTASWLTVDFTPIGYSTVPAVVASGQGEAVSSPSAGAASGWIELTSKSSPAGGAPEVGGFSLLARTSTGANANPLVEFIAIGT